MRNTSVLGVPLSMMRKEEMLTAMGEAIRLGDQLSVVAINARKVVRAVREPQMRHLILGFDLFLADGSAVVKAADYTVERITGIDLKMCIRDRVSSYIHTYGFPANVTHCGNNYGPRQHREKFLPTVIRNLLEGKEIPVYGDGKMCIRDRAVREAARYGGG